MLFNPKDSQAEVPGSFNPEYDSLFVMGEEEELQERKTFHHINRMTPSICLLPSCKWCLII